MIGGGVAFVDIYFNPIGGYGEYAYTRDYGQPIAIIIGGVALGMFFLLSGRAVRYIFSNE